MVTLKAIVSHQIKRACFYPPIFSNFYGCFNIPCLLYINFTPAFGVERFNGTLSPSEGAVNSSASAYRLQALFNLGYLLPLLNCHNVILGLG